jgi:hypothetical protein
MVSDFSFTLDVTPDAMECLGSHHLFSPNQMFHVTLLAQDIVTCNISFELADPFVTNNIRLSWKFQDFSLKKSLTSEKLSF